MSKGLNAYIVKDARRMAAAGMTVAEIGTQLGLEPARLADAIQGVTYGYMKHPPAVAVGGGSREAREPGGLGNVWLLDPGSVRALRTERLGLSQRQFAELIQRVCVYLGFDGVGCSKRLVQKWESGEHAMPLGHYRKALAFVAGESIERLRVFMPSGELGNPTDRLLEILARHDRLRTEAQSIHDALVSVYVELANGSGDVVADGPVPGGVAGADLVGVSKSTVRVYTRDLPRQRPERVGVERSARIRELRGAGLSQRKIAAEMGVSLSTVRRHLRAGTGPELPEP